MRRFPFVPLVAFALLSAVAAASPAHAADAARRSVSVVGVGKVLTQPDQVEISTGVASEGKTAMDALRKNTATMTKMVTLLKADGISARDMQTTDLSVQPVYDTPEGGKGSKLKGYRVENSIRLTVHEVTQLGPVLDKLVQLGANQVSSIVFSVSDPTTYENLARKRAMQSAIAKARLYADAAGAVLGDVLSISEDEGGYQPYAAAAPRMQIAKAVPIEPGTATTSIRLHVTWELK